MEHRAKLQGLFVSDPQVNNVLIVEAPKETRERLYARLLGE